MTAIQLAIEAVNAVAVSDESQLLIAAKCRGLLCGYDARWRNVAWRALSIEQIRTGPLSNVQAKTMSTSRSFKLAGKLDLIATDGNRTIVVDHKTTGDSIHDPDSPYWRQLVVEGQPTHYLLLEWLNQNKLDGAMWDVTRKPSISPKKLSKADRTAVSSFGRYCNRKMSDETRKALSDGQESETLEMYEARLSHDCTVERPEWYFQRRMVPRLDEELIDYADMLWQIGKDMLSVRANNWHHKNSGACLLYGSACKFLGICSNHDTPDSDRWQRKAFVHNELDGLAGDGRELITNSRVRCFQTCRRKHYYEYELGIERQDEEEKEALYFGRLYHVGLSAWWTYFLEDKHDNGSGVSLNAGEQQPGGAASLAR